MGFHSFKVYFSTMMLLVLIVFGHGAQAGMLPRVYLDQTAPDEVLASIDHAWAFSVGTGYAFINNKYTTGDLASTDEAAATHAYVGNDNLNFQYSWVGDAELKGYLNHYLAASLAYMHFQTHTSPGKEVGGEGGDAGLQSSYSADIAINTVLFKIYLNFWHVFSTVNTPISVFMAGGVGASSIELSKQLTFVENGAFSNVLQNNSVWQLSYSGEAGLNIQLDDTWAINLGGRYIYYGQMDSGTNLTNYSNGAQKAPVKAKLYAVEPFLNISWLF